MTAHTRKLLQESNLALATRLSRKLSVLPNVQTVLLYGSVGKGYSDQYSDIDLVLVCDVPTAAVLKNTKEVARLLPEYDLAFKKQELSVLQFDQYPSVGGASRDAYPSYRAHCVVTHDGREIDTTVRLVSASVVKKLAADAVRDTATYQTLMQYIVDTLTLFDRTRVFDAWKKKAAAFRTFAPDLYRTFLDHCLARIDYYLKGEIPDSIIRNDTVLRHYELAKCVVLFLNVLYALNDRCLAYPKWEHEDIKRLPIKPADIQRKLERITRDQDPSLIADLMHDLRAYL